MTLKQIIEALFQDGGPIILLFVIATTLVQVAPIKINPWSAIVRWVGDRLNTSVVEKIDNLDSKVDKLEDKVEKIEDRLDKHIEDSAKAEIRARRQAILDFASSLIRGDNYTREKFEFMVGECDSYKKYCADNEIINGVADASMREIKRVYEERYRTGSFLPDQGSAVYSSNNPVPVLNQEG